MANKLHILILEDNPDEAEIVQRLLLKEIPGVECSLAENKDEFLKILDLSQPDVILADNSLPQFSATEALFMLRERSLRIPFILVTGTVSEEFAAGIIKLGADDYILKDRLARLPGAIEAALKQWKAENDRLKAISRLIEREEQYRTLIERITDAFIVLDTDWCYSFVNKQAGLLIKRDPNLLIGKNVWTEFPDVVGTLTYNAFVQAMTEQRYISNVDYYAPLDLWQENHIYPSNNGLSIFIRDITVRKKSEMEVLQMNTELRELSSHLQNIREEERIHIAREIHDDLGQQLTALKMDMRWVQKRLTDKDIIIIEKIEGIVSLIDETVKSVRRIASDLRPSILDDLGLIAALEWHSKEVEKRSEIKVDFSSSAHNLILPVETATAIFRIYQEVLTNAVRHSNASVIVGSLEVAGHSLCLHIKDNGKGMDKIAIYSGKTLGLVGIKERTFILGGKFEFHSEPGEGTEVNIIVPYQPK
jgi:two-component system sensor histidine kinase UhpB